jgi:formylglycine-generating enzyme required for sulfatase activity
MKKFQVLVIIALAAALSLFLTGCGKPKEEAPAAEAAPDTAAAPSITPGEMVLIPAGEFTFGHDGEPTTAPMQKITTPAYYIDKYEVTMAEYLKFTVEAGYQAQGDWRSLWAPDKANFPVVNITWDDAVAYAKWAQKRLPTEVEWEKAARGEKGFRYPWGDEWQPSLSNTFESGLKAPAEVGSYAGDVSPYGVRDMLGNVKEWTADSFKPYPGSKAQNKDFGDKFRVLRGADYATYGGKYGGVQFHVALRSYYLPDAHFNFGFRCAKDAPPGATK